MLAYSQMTITDANLLDEECHIEDSGDDFDNTVNTLYGHQLPICIK